MLVSGRRSDWVMVLQGDNHLPEKNLHQENPERRRSREILTVQLEKLPPIWSETETSNSNHRGNYEFNSILLLNEIDLENWMSRSMEQRKMLIRRKITKRV